MDSLNNTFSESDLNCDAEQKYSLNIPEGNFKASNGWTWRFMKRFGFTERAATSLGQNIPVNAKDLALNYLKWIQTHCKGIALSTIGGMDETPLQVEMPGSAAVSDLQNDIDQEKSDEKTGLSDDEESEDKDEEDDDDEEELPNI